MAVFVEANDRQSAAVKIPLLIGTLYGCPPEDVSFYNLDSYFELLDESGIDDDMELRIFESGWDADSVTSWVKNPLFLAPLNQSFLLATWGRLQRRLEELSLEAEHQVRPCM
jgi:hypothetical protein